METQREVRQSLDQKVLRNMRKRKVGNSNWCFVIGIWIEWLIFVESHKITATNINASPRKKMTSV